jgi:hypothetical protein
VLSQARPPDQFLQMKRADILTALAVPSFDWEVIIGHARSRTRTLQPLHRSLLTFLSDNYQMAVEWNNHRACVSALILRAEQGDPLVGQVLAKLEEKAFRWLFGPDIAEQAVAHLLLSQTRHDPNLIKGLYNPTSAEAFQQAVFLALTWTAVVDKHEKAKLAFEDLAKPILLSHGSFTSVTNLDESDSQFWIIRCVAQCASVIDPVRWVLSLQSLAQKGIFDFEPPENTDWNMEEAFSEAFKSGSPIHVNEWKYMQHFSWFGFMCSDPSPSQLLRIDPNLSPDVLNAVCLLARPQHDYVQYFESILELSRDDLIPVVRAGLAWAYSEQSAGGFIPFLEGLVSLSILFPDVSLHEPLLRVTRAHPSFGEGPEDSGFRLGQALIRTVGDRQDRVDELFEMAESSNEWAEIAGSAIAYGAVGPQQVRNMIWKNLTKIRNKEWVSRHIDFTYDAGGIAGCAPNEKAKAVFLSFAGEYWELDNKELGESMAWESPRHMSDSSNFHSVTKAHDVSTNMRGLSCMSKTVRERRAEQDRWFAKNQAQPRI